jgi:hypothetical protein
MRGMMAALGVRARREQGRHRALFRPRLRLGVRARVDVGRNHAWTYRSGRGTVAHGVSAAVTRGRRAARALWLGPLHVPLFDCANLKIFNVNSTNCR